MLFNQPVQQNYIRRIPLSVTGPKNVLITGSARRIGAAIAQDLAEHGANIIVHHHSSFEDADTLLKTLNLQNIKAVQISADLSDPKQCEALFEQSRQELGAIDLLINNASIFEDDSALDFEPEKFDKHFELHVKAPSMLSAQMAKQSEISDGLIVNMIDQRVWRANPNFYSYSLSKAALWMATKTMAQSFAPRIRVNAIGPGPTLPNDRQNASDFKKQTSKVLLKRGPMLTEFGSTIRYMWEAKSMTGQMIALDGGQHLAWETPDIYGIKE